MITRLLPPALLTGALILAADPGIAASRSDTVQQALAGMKMSETEMKGMRHSKMVIGKSYSSSGTWIPLETCKGSLVIYMDRYHRKTGMTTTGDCTMEHVKSR